MSKKVEQRIDTITHCRTLMWKYIHDGKQILLVDDNIDELSSICNVLNNQKYKVLWAVDPHEALRMFREHPELFDLIITDLKMPGMQGDELVFFLRQIRKDIPVIACSGSEADLMNLQEQGADIQEYILKPFSCIQLTDAVKRLIG